MHVRLRLDARRPRRWHALLAAELSDGFGCAVDFDLRPSPDPWTGSADLLFRLEAAIHRLPDAHMAAPARPSDLARWPGIGPARPDIVVDLCGDVPKTAAPRVWTLSYDGIPGERGLLAALLDDRPPIAALAEGDRVLEAGRIGTEVRGVVRTAFEDGVSRSTTLIAAAVAKSRMPGTAAPPPWDIPPRAPSPRLGLGDVAGRAGRAGAGALVRRLYRLGFNGPHWRVGWRRLDGPDVASLGHHPAGGWQSLPDDGSRFYADPFPIVHDGTCTLFVEDYVHAKAKGVISAVRFGPDGPLGTPVPVLEEPHHLSYPFVFARDGAVWMVPESCANGTVDLYRATAFPGGWVKEATLLSGVTASDATLFERDGRWWMFATLRHAAAAAPLGRGCFSDALHLWSAPDFRGPWTPHAANPVLIDIAAARPAGRVVERDGRLIRPVQDCSAGYGAALALARIDRLDDEGFGQTVVARLAPGPSWPGSRLHTLNAAGGFEFIDGSARALRFAPLAARLRRGAGAPPRTDAPALARDPAAVR